MSHIEVRSPLDGMTPEKQIELLRKAYPGRVMTDGKFQSAGETQRLLLPLKILAAQLRCPRDLLRAYLKIGALHEAKSDIPQFGQKTELGLCAEQLVGLAIGADVANSHSAPFFVESGSEVIEGTTALYGGWRLAKEIETELYSAVGPVRVLVGVLTSRRGTEICVRNGEGDLVGVDSVGGAMLLYDATQLREGFEAAIVAVPLKLPRARRCLVRG